MGIIDIHFHDSEFGFSPELHVGPAFAGEEPDEDADPSAVGDAVAAAVSGAEEDAGETETADGEDDLHFPNDAEEGEDGGGPGRALLGLLAVAVVVWLLRRGDDEDGPEPEPEPEPETDSA